MKQQLIISLLIIGGFASSASADLDWPPAPKLEYTASAADLAPLPRSVNASNPTVNEWRTTFTFRPDIETRNVSLVGSFNGWDRSATPMTGPDDNGAWSVEVMLTTGVHEYKFLVNDEEWFFDPYNLDRKPDGFGGYNSTIRLGKLARMDASDATVGDGQIDVLGLEHRTDLPMYVQPTDEQHVRVRYRTMSRDVERVTLSRKNGDPVEMQQVSAGPLFTYWEALVNLASNDRSPKVRRMNYTFVLNDGATEACDPQTYYYAYTAASLFDTPDWAKHAVWYQIMVDRFRNGDPSNDPDGALTWTSAWFTPQPGENGEFYSFVFDRHYGGDLAGLEEKLPYLKDLGVNALYLMPIFEAPSNHKYDLSNWLHVDDNFGVKGDYAEAIKSENLLEPSTWTWTESDKRFLAFIEKAHEMGFKVVLDGVFNHTGVEHPAFLDTRERGRRSVYADWFDIVSYDPFTYRGWSDFAHMPVLAKSHNGFRSPQVKQHIFNITKRWMDPDGDGDPSDGIDGWRLDVPSDIPRQFWAEWRRHVKQINPNALITGEIWHRADRWLDGHHFDAVMNYEFSKAAVAWIFDRDNKIKASEVAARLAELRLAYPEAATYTCQTLIGSHDTDRVVSMAANPDRDYDRQNRVQDNNPDYSNDKPSEEAYRRARLVALLQMTYVGAPMIYYGDEAGMWGADDPTNRKPMLWSDLGPYAEPGAQIAEDHLDFYRQAIALRNEYAALRVGEFATVLADDTRDIWAFERRHEGERVMVVLNASEASHQVDLPTTGDWRVALGADDAYESAGDATRVSLPPVSGVVLVESTPQTAAR